MRECWRKYWVIILLTAVTLVGGYIWRTQCGGHDADLEFHYILPQYHPNPGDEWMWQYVQTWDDAWNRWNECIAEDNMRLAQLYTIVAVSLMPRWLEVGLNTLFLAALPLLILLLAGRRSALRRPLLACGVYAGIFLFLPWYDHLCTTAYYANYLIPAVITLLAMYLGRYWRAGAGYWLLTTLVVAVGAWWHEMNGVVQCAFFAILAMFAPRRSAHLWWLAAVSVACAALSILLSGGMMMRLFDSLNKTMYTEGGGRASADVLIDMASTWIFVGLAVAAVTLRRWRQRIDWRYIVALSVAILCAIVVCWVSRLFARAYFLCAVLSLAGIVSMLLPLHTRLPRLAVGAIVALFAGAYMALLLFVAHYQQAMYENKVQLNNDIYQSAQQPIVFTDVADDRQMPFWLLEVVPKHTIMGMDMVIAGQAPNLIQRRVCFPKSFKGKDYEALPFAPGSKLLRGTADQWIMDCRYDTLRAQVYWGEAFPSQAPWKQIMRSAVYGPGTTQLEVILHCDSLGRYPVGDPNGKTIYKYWFDGVGLSLRNVHIDSVKIADPRLSEI